MKQIDPKITEWRKVKYKGKKWEAMHMEFNSFKKRFWWFFRHK